MCSLAHAAVVVAAVISVYYDRLRNYSEATRLLMDPLTKTDVPLSRVLDRGAAVPLFRSMRCGDIPGHVDAEQKVKPVQRRASGIREGAYCPHITVIKPSRSVPLRVYWNLP